MLFKVDYFDERTKDLPSFMGFVPRWYVPRVEFDFEVVDYPVTLTMMILDQVKENYVGVGYDWPPITLGKGEIMVQ